MMTFGKFGPVLGRRKIGVRRWEPGEWVAGSFESGAESQFEIMASVQPAGKTELQQLDEAERKLSPKLVITRSELVAGDEIDQTVADELTINGRPYKVSSANRLTLDGRRYHTEAIALLKKKAAKSEPEPEAP